MFNNIIKRYKDNREAKKRRWHIIISHVIWITFPNRMFLNNEWKKWSKLQRIILSRLTQNWPEAYTCIRFIDFPQGYFSKLLKNCQYESLSSSNPKENILLFADCKDDSTLDIIYQATGMNPFTRCIFVLDKKPEKLQDTISHYFNLAQEISRGHKAANFADELKECHFLGYSMDNDLVIGKIDLPENIVTSILQDIATAESLEAVIKNIA
jgi:hypothetical protein